MCGSVKAMDLRDLCATAASRPLNEEERTTFNSLITGVDRTLGTRYVHISAQEVSLELEITPKVLQPWGIVHGGVYAALAESAASVGSLVATGARRGVAGISNSTDFMASASHGTIRATARPVHTGRTLHLWEVSCECEGRILARSTVRCIVLSPRMD